MRLCILCLPAVVFLGCGSALVEARLEELEHKLAESQKRAATAQARAEALEDKIFLLTDQLESQKVASVPRAAPRLPVVMLRPAEKAPPEGEEVAFVGEARSSDPSRARPHLVIDDSRPKAPPPKTTPVATANENLGVAPAPHINVAPPQYKIAAPHNNDPLKAYRDAYELLRVGKHDEAARAFRDFIKRFPEHDYADNAQYWLGECFYGRRMFAEAAAEFRTVVTRHPFGNKAPDALLKLAFCLISLGETGKARALLAEVPKSYPRTEAARLAAERLEELARVAPTGGTQ